MNNGKMVSVSKAFTVRIPSAVLILMGVKKWENRDVLPFPNKGRCGMSCSKGSNEYEYAEFSTWWERHFKFKVDVHLPSWDQVKGWRGKMVAVMDYEACDRWHLNTITPSNAITDNNVANLIVSEEIFFWNKNREYWWRLTNINPLKEPFAVRGDLGMWNFTGEL